MKKVLLTIALMLLPMLASAGVEIDGIYYNLNAENKNAAVTYGDWITSYYIENDDRYAGDVVIPETVEYGGKTYRVTTIGNSAFSFCYGLTSITIPNSVTAIGNFAFNGCIVLTSVTIPDGVTSIGMYAFNSCNMTSITIPDGVTSIGNSAFQNCSRLKSVTIGSSVTSIGESAFYNCKALEEVSCRAENVPNTHYTAFYASGGIYGATLYVPAVAVEAYKAAEPWNQFKTIVAIGSAETGEGDANGDGSTDVADIDFVIEHIGEAVDDANRASDVNGDGSIDVADVDYIIEQIK